MGTVPPTTPVVAGTKAMASDHNGLVSMLAFLATPPMCMAIHSVSQTPASGAWTLITFTSEAFDVANNYDGGSDAAHHDNATNPSRIYIRTSGKYEVTGQISFSSNATGARQAAIYKNSNGDTTLATGTELTASKQGAVSGVGTAVPLTTVVVPLVAGDYVEMFAFQSSGGGLSTQTGQSLSNLRIRWVST